MAQSLAQTQLQTLLDTLMIKLRRYLETFQATGQTLRSLRSEVKPDGTGAKVYVADHLMNRMDGRKAGKIPYNFHLDILRWLTAKGLGNEQSIKFAKAIAWNIHWHGTKQQKKRSVEFFRIIKEWKEKDVREWAVRMHIQLAKDMFQLKKIN